MIKLKPLQWSGPNTPKVDIPYDNMIAYTPLGKFVLTWKSWKAESGNMGIGFDETPWGEAWYDFWDTPEQAMRAAEVRLQGLIQEMLALPEPIPESR